MGSPLWLCCCAAVALVAAVSCRSAAARELLHTAAAPLHTAAAPLHRQLQLQQHHRLHRRSAYYCGSELVDMLSMVCGPAGISGSSGKRAQPPIPVDLVSYNSLDDWSSDASVRIHSRLHARPPSAALEGRWLRDREADRASNALDAGESSVGTGAGASRWRRSLRRQWRLRQRRRRSTSASASSWQPHRRVKREGIVEECCYNPCGLQTLKSYCNDV